MIPVNYENQVCPGCGKAFGGDDDIVVCPECATPQHRECWKSEGRCVNESLHSSGYVWKNEEIASDNTAEPEAEAEPQNRYDNGKTRVCHVCGSENPVEIMHCGNCGALLGESGNGRGSGFFNSTGYVAGTDIPSDEKIGRNDAGELALYLRTSAGRYIKKFKRFESGKKFSFNFAALFFSPYWFFYRKLYKPGIFLLVALVTLNIFNYAAGNVLSDRLDENLEAIKPLSPFMAAFEEYGELYSSGEYTIEDEEILAASGKVTDELEKVILNSDEIAKNYSSQVTEIGLITAASLACDCLPFLLSLACAFIADRLYYKKILADMKEIDRSAGAHEDSKRKMLIFRKGGLAPLAFAGSLLGENVLVYAIYYAADFIKSI